MRYKLRTLLILLALGPPVLAGCYFVALRVLADDLDNYRMPQSGVVFEIYQPAP